jgi:DNA-nicking Smr family endonuclease
MSVDQDNRRRPRRQLSEDEQRLWSSFTRAIAPLKRRRRKTQQRDAIELAPGKPAPLAPVRARPEAATAHRSAAKPSPSLAPIERREKQRLARGVSPIDARIDLHGRSQADAHAALLGFLRRAQADGARFVLVITGKGGGSNLSSGRGVLKRQVPLWLTLPEFRLYVVAAEAAHAAHGGEGALYVRLRRSRG